MLLELPRLSCGQGLRNRDPFRLVRFHISLIAYLCNVYLWMPVIMSYLGTFASTLSNYAS